MTCFFCKGKTVKSVTKFIVDLGDCVVIIWNVPAYVCRQCGEASYDNEVARHIEAIVENVKHSMVREIAIVEYSENVA